MYSRRMSTEPLEKTSKFGADLISSLYKPSLTSSDHQIDVVSQQSHLGRLIQMEFRMQIFAWMMRNLYPRNDLRRTTRANLNLKMKETVACVSSIATVMQCDVLMLIDSLIHYGHNLVFRNTERFLNNWTEKMSIKLDPFGMYPLFNDIPRLESGCHYL